MIYVTLAEANQYVTNYYSSTNILRDAWDALVSSDKQALLNRAEQLIEQLPYTGKPVSLNKAFPREPHVELSLIKVKQAVMELAIQSLDANDRYDLRMQGVKSYRLGDLSETFRDGSVDTLTKAIKIVQPILSEWMNGGYNICHTHFKR